MVFSDPKVSKDRPAPI